VGNQPAFMIDCNNPSTLVVSRC